MLTGKANTELTSLTPLQPLMNAVLQYSSLWILLITFLAFF